MHCSPGVLTPSAVRLELRRHRLSVGTSARILRQWLACPSTAARAEAISVTLELEQIDPEEPSVWALLGALDRQDESAEAGRPRPAKAEENGRTTIGDGLVHARFLLGAGRPRVAEGELVGILGRDPDNAVAKVLLFRAKQLQSNLRDAMRIWERISAAQPQSNALLELRQLYDNAVRTAPIPSEDAIQPTPPSDADRCRGELTRAFQAASTGNTAEAVAICRRLAGLLRTTDRPGYKLATIAQGWMLEVLGRSDLARSVFEDVVTEGDLERDVDLLLSLGRLLEQDPTAVESTLGVYWRVLEIVGDRAFLSKLARLYEKNGDSANAERLRRRHRAAFEQDIGYMTLRQLVWVASRRHLSLADLAKFRFEPAELSLYARRPLGGGAMALRKEAILRILSGDRSGAEGLFRRLVTEHRASPLDLAYLGELALVADRPDLASRCYRKALHCGPKDEGPISDGVLMGYILTARDATWVPSLPEGAAIAEYSHPPIGRGLLAELARNRRSEPEVWRALARASRLLGHEEEGSRHDSHAELLERVGPNAIPLGHALAVAAYHGRGDRKGMVHELWVSRYRIRSYGAGQLAEHDIFANVTDEFRLYLRSVFDSTKTYARAKFPHRTATIDEYAYQFKLTNEDERSSGPSAGLAIAICFMSLFLGKAVPPDTALSGVLVTEARDRLALRRVGDADIKLEAALARRVRRFVLPDESRADVEQSDIVPRATAESIVAYAQDLDEAMESVFGPDIWLW